MDGNASMSISELSHNEIRDWLSRALRGKESLPRLTPDESPHLGILRLEKTLKPAARDSLRDACYELVREFCVDGIGDAAYVEELLALTSAFKKPESVQLLAQLVDRFPQLPQTSDEVRLAVLAALVDTPPPQPPAFWQGVLKQDPEKYAGLALSGLLATHPAQAINLLPAMPDTERAGQAVALKLDLTWDDLPPKKRFQFVQDIQAKVPQCGSHFAGPVMTWALTRKGPDTTTVNPSLRMKDVLAVVLAGGKGSRLDPLTRDRAKPAIPFGGSYRIIDFVLSNCLNSGIYRMLVLTQYKAASLDRHINLGWRRLFNYELDEFIDVMPPQQRIDADWYQGTADAVYQNIYSIEKLNPQYVVILPGDHIYKMNYRTMVEYHRDVGADLTIGAFRVDVNAARYFGVMQIDADQRIVGFEEKPDKPKTIPGDDKHCLSSMGVYVFTAQFLYKQLCLDAARPDSDHDFGRDIIPSIIDTHRAFVFPFRDENHASVAYWRDVGTVDAYFEANMELVGIDPLLNIYDDDWPIRTYQSTLPPSKFVFGSKGDREPQFRVLDSIVCQGCIVSGGQVERSILGPQVRVNSYAHVEDSILFEGVNIGRHANVRRAVIEKGISIPPGARIGYDLELDRQRGFTVSEGGVVVLAKSDGRELFSKRALTA